MPAQYEAMRDKFKREGMSAKAAKSKAARIYNAKHPEKLVTGSHRASYRKALKKRKRRRRS